jgi:quercetin dioxygenase-like cupin family protein
MSLPGHHGLRVLHVPKGGGTAVWVYKDKDTIKVGHEETGGAIAVVETEFKPGDGPPPHTHKNEHEAFYVLEGEVAALDGDRRFVAGPGSFVFFPRNSRHAFKNVGTTMAKILLLFIPAGFEGYLKEVGEIVVEGQDAPETDMAKALPIAKKYGMEFIDVPPGVWD